MELKLDSLGYADHVLTVVGSSTGSDIKWNNLHADVQVRNKEGLTLECEIAAFTHNCGVKSISRLYPGGPTNHIAIAQKLWPVLECFLRHRTNCSMVLASDGISGGMSSILQAIGFAPVFGPMHNPNYGAHGDHPIVLFGKNILSVYDSVKEKEWNALCKGSLNGQAPTHEYYENSTFAEAA